MATKLHTSLSIKLTLFLIFDAAESLSNTNISQLFSQTKAQLFSDRSCSSLQLLIKNEVVVAKKITRTVEHARSNSVTAAEYFNATLHLKTDATSMTTSLCSWQICKWQIYSHFLQHTK